MGTECIGARIKDASDGTPSAPPGFASLTSFTLQRVQENALASSCASNSMQTQMDMEASTVSDGKFKKSLRHRPWISYSQFYNSSEEEESDTELLEQDVPSLCSLPKGVFRGCAECSNCQKVIAKWHPQNACRPVLDEAPVFYPTEEEFKYTLKYIASIRPRAEPYGICRIVPPPSWSPPCPLKEKSVWENSKFVTRIQKVHKLQKRDSVKKNCRNRSPTKRKKRKLLKMGAECRNSNENIAERNELGYYNSAERFGFEPGPSFTLESFQKYADDFKEQYFRKEEMDIDLMSGQWEPSVENIEGEYWRIVEQPTEDIEVLYGADLETGDFGSGFPKVSSAPLSSGLEDEYVKSGWNLNNFPRLPGSVLSFESGDISGVLMPWLYIGMCFSSFCWHVEDHHLYSLNYLHWGAPKMWYGVPGRDALKLEAAMKKHLADLFEEQPDLLHNLVTQFSPSMLKLEGVPVYRCLQRSGEFVLTFPQAYHSGFNCGFNCAEAVNVAPMDWLPHGQNAVELYREQVRKISISHDKLLLGAAREAVRAQWNILFLGKNTVDNLRWKDACGLDGILAKALKARVEMERVRREFLCSSESRKMDASFDANSERECVVCHYDLHLSAAGCPCSPDRFACLIHAKKLCSCSWGTRFFLFRYEISELNVLIDALGGKLSAVHRWGISYLGLSLSSFVSKDKTPGSKSSIRTTSSETTKQKDNRPLSQGILLSGDAKSYTSSQEIKASIARPSTLVVPKEGEKMSVAVDSTCNVADLSSLFRKTKSTTMCISKEPCLQGRSSVSRDKTPESKSPNRTTSSEATKQKDKGPLSQGILLSGGAKSYTSSQEIKASFVRPSTLEVPKEGEKVSVAVDSTCLVADPSSLCQQTNSTATCISKESCLQHGSFSEIGGGEKLQSLEGCRYSGLNSSGFSGQAKFQNGMPDQMGFSQLVPGCTQLSNSVNVVSKKETNISASNRDVILLTDDDREGAQVLPSFKIEEEQFVENPEVLARLTNYDDKVTTCNLQKDRVPVTPETNASVITESNNDLHLVMEQNGNHSTPAFVGVNDQEKEGPSNLPNQCLVGSFPNKTSHCKNSVSVPISKQISEFLAAKEEGDCSITNTVQHSQLLGSVNTDNESKDGKSGSDSVHNLSDRGESVTASPSCPSNSLDRHNRVHKGPRMAKVVRRINCNVEPLEFGVVFSGKLWSTSQAIFPKGYRSRVKYLSIRDPTEMCYYVSEILDAGLLGPLFMVNVDHCPSEVFFHVSATKCWDMVRERVNHEIRRQHSLGRVNLPSLQPPGSLDGLEMFGLTSPTIIPAIEAIDHNHDCWEYWRSRPHQPPTPSNPMIVTGDREPCLKEERGKQEQSLIPRADVTLRSLFKKANPEELHALHSILSGDQPSSKKELMELLSEEMEGSLM